jgi:hypothetical protein
MKHLLIAFLFTPGAALAEDLASADAIRAAIIGNTVEGAMSASGGYAEYYAADGTIRAADYQGRWSFAGKTMCFAYGEDPATCFGAQISGAKVVWIGVSGEEGSGTIRSGNPGGW